MAASARNIACFALFVSIISLQVSFCIEQQQGTAAGTGTASASAQPPPFDGARALQIMLPLLAGMEALFILAAIIYSNHPHHAAAAAGNWRISELVFFILCLQVGLLQFKLFVQEPAAGGADEDDALARSLGVAAVHGLPAVASATFFLGITLIFAHVGNGGGGAAGAVAGNGPVSVPASLRLLANMTLGAALICLMGIVLVF